ncbi:MAG: hypothetical protein HQL26_10450 [Candidatus Omnitrophica bacterium]|nr:hypothetical protein [Candidatus Omnitrophota bacterium]
MLSKKEKEVIAYFSVNDVGLSSHPFIKPAKTLDLTEVALIDILTNLQKKGIIKNFSGVIDHKKTGYKANALIAWNINLASGSTKINKIIDIFMGDNRISHFYQRAPNIHFNYNIYTMMHAKTKKEIKDFAEKVASECNLNYEILFTEKELKKEKLRLGEMLC